MYQRGRFLHTGLGYTAHAMSCPEPHYLLFAEAAEDGSSPRWRFLLQAVDGTQRLEAEEAEPAVRGERLGLLAVVRALESLEQPSHVTLAACPDYVRRGLVFGLDEWRRQGWRWEWFDQLVPVRNCDLWQRMDRALAFHRLETAGWRFDPPHCVSQPHAMPTTQPVMRATPPGTQKVPPNQVHAALPSAGPATRHSPMAAQRPGCGSCHRYRATVMQETLGLKSVWLRRRLSRSRRRVQWICAFVSRALREAACRAAARITQLCTPLAPPPWYG